MKCSNCKAEMEKGVLLANGQNWLKSNPSSLYKLMFGNPGSHNVVAWRCPECDSLQFKTAAK